MGKDNTKRQLLPDILKGVAVLLMIQVHLMELFATQGIYDSMWGKISLFLGGPPAAPIFMAVMGYFIAKSESGTVQSVMRGLKLIVYGLLLNVGLNLHLLYHIFIGEQTLNPLPYLFGVDILFLAGLSVIAIAVLRLILRNSLFGWLLLTLLVASAGLFIPSGEIDGSWLTYLLAFIVRETWWSYFPLFPWLAYPLAGYSFYLISKSDFITEISKSKLLLVGGSLLILLLITFSYGFNITVDLPAYYHHATTYFLWAMLFLAFWVIVISYLVKHTAGNPVNKYLQWTGRNVTAFYVFQWLLIGNLATAFYKTVSAGYLVLWFLGITIATSCLVWIYKIVKAKYRADKRVGLV